MHRIITLTTDFGLADEYVGVMKGVILARAPAAVIVDLSHAVARHDVLEAGLLIKASYSYFPAATIHVVVVDPGVGSKRRLILLQADGHFFLAPDNGALGLLLAPECYQAAYELQCEQYYLSPVSGTFHGRDILAPVAAELAAGLAPAAVGPAVARQSLLKSQFSTAALDSKEGTIIGQVIGVDRFGNLRTNITEESLRDLCGSRGFPVQILIKDKVIHGVRTSYSQTPPGHILALVGSRRMLEIAVNQGDAAAVLAAAKGDAVRGFLAKM